MVAQIATSRVTSYEIPVRVPFAIATQTLPCAKGSFVEIIDEDGRVGLGEAAPFPVLTQDDAASAHRHTFELLDMVQGNTPEKALATLLTLRVDSFRQSRTAYVAVEAALWDLTARQKAVPLATLWGSKPYDVITTDITLPIMPVGHVASFWNMYQAHDFPVVKIKVSGHVSSDLDLVVTTRNIVGPAVAMTLDGNQGFTPENAIKLVSKLHAHGISPIFFEQPLPAQDYDGLRQLASSLPIPVCLDETVVTAQDAVRVARDNLAGIINLKIMKSSIAETLAIIPVAQKAGMRLMIGGMLETEVAMGVSLHLACGTGAVTYVDLDTPFFMVEESCVASPWSKRSAHLALGTGAGHAMTLRPGPEPESTRTGGLTGV